MKILKYFLSAAALLSLAAACSHDPEEMTVSSADPVIASHSAVTVNNVTVDETFTLVWSAAKFGAPVEVEYTVSAKSSAGDYVVLGSTDACFFSTTNAALFEAVGIALTGEYDVTFSVEALSAAGAVRSAQPRTVHFTYDRKTYLHLIGSYSNWATGTGAMSRVLQGEDGIFRGFVFFPADGEFKFASQPDWSGTNYGPGEGEGVLSDADDAKNFSVAAGLYYVTADIEKLVFTMEPTTVSVAFGGHDEKMVYNAADKTWVAIADVSEGDSYTVKFDGLAAPLALGGSETNLEFDGEPLSLAAGGIVSFKLSIFDYPYSVAVGEVVEDDKKLYVAHSANGWNYFEAPELKFFEEGKFYGLMNFIGAASPEVLLARLQSPLGTQYGGTAAALETYLGGAEAAPIAAAAGLRFYAVDLSGEDKVLYDTEITDAAVVLAGEPATTLAMTADGAGKWTLTHEFDAVGKFSVALNGGAIACGDTEYPAVLGGSCTGLSLDGAALNMTKGEHTLVLDLSGAVMTLEIDGEIADLQLYPEAIGVTGDFGDINWAAAAAPQLPGDVETGKYGGYVSMYGLTYGFKFTYGDTWVPGQAVEGADNEFTLGVGDNMMIAEGLYRWDVDLDAMTAKAVPLTKVGLIGDGVGGWDNDQAELVRDPEDGLYKAAGVVCPGGEFKIRFNSDWDYSLGGTADNLIDNAGNMTIEAGTYSFALDLTHTPYKLTMTAAE
ncbi:MAG: hypothetical protein K2I62_08425 [Alistipes sp.]|nr:hypothetical protein [Alistipes sp.]